ncbi:hypothetical protein LG204_13185 [Methylovorus menthalis]|uniref:hypothetical protein n=1 Tax=Methylovorus menthalis TaxID=1002227 RepID=UPI001E59A512|nr:hypothetical protein [Methylovorus menthalis]MCB4812269.1 hypothetical protein [Methylovorus menthalis]
MTLLRMKFLLKTLAIAFFSMIASTSALSQSGFSPLPNAENGQSAYILCNPSGRFGLGESLPPQGQNNDTCSVSSPALINSAASAPMSGYRLIGVLVSDVQIPAKFAGSNDVAAIMTDAIWRNDANTECILGIQLEMKDAPLNNGDYFEINDIVRSGFSNKQISVAYFHKPHTGSSGGNTEVLFRAGRSFTSSLPEEANPLPMITGAPIASSAFSDTNSAAYSDNWVTFTTDISFHDIDGSSRAISSIFYIHYPCDARDPVVKPDAIRLRSAGHGKQDRIEVAVAGLVPADGEVEKY